MVSEKGTKLKPYSKDDYPMLEEPKYIRFKFRKVGNLQFISHLDLQKAMAKVLVRAKAPLWYSKGFNPHAKLIFALPLSVGAQSECEYLDVRVERAIPPLELMEHINAELTEELRFLDAYYPETKLEDIYWAEYDFDILTEGADENLAREVEKLLCGEQVIILKKAKDRIESYKLPVIPNYYYVQLSEANVAIKEMIKEMNMKPVSIKTLNIRVDTARDLVLKLYNTSNEIIRTAALVETAIVYGNRYRPVHKNLDRELTRAEDLFYNGEYKKALDNTIRAINVIEPGIQKKLLESARR
jgi:radical SAM-linked protein